MNDASQPLFYHSFVGARWALTPGEELYLEALLYCFGHPNGTLSLSRVNRCPSEVFNNTLAFFWAIKDALQICPSKNPGHWLQLTALTLERFETFAFECPVLALFLLQGKPGSVY